MMAAKSMLSADNEMTDILIVSGCRNLNLIDLSRRETRFMLDIGAGAAAVVLPKGYNRNLLLATALK